MPALGAGAGARKKADRRTRLCPSGRFDSIAIASLRVADSGWRRQRGTCRFGAWRRVTHGRRARCL